MNEQDTLLTLLADAPLEEQQEILQELKKAMRSIQVETDKDKLIELLMAQRIQMQINLILQATIYQRLAQLD